jgi:hypothetical protein
MRVSAQPQRHVFIGMNYLGPAGWLAAGGEPRPAQARRGRHVHERRVLDNKGRAAPARPPHLPVAHRRVPREQPPHGSRACAGDVARRRRRSRRLRGQRDAGISATSGAVGQQLFSAGEPGLEHPISSPEHDSPGNAVPDLIRASFWKYFCACVRTCKNIFSATNCGWNLGQGSNNHLRGIPCSDKSGYGLYVLWTKPDRGNSAKFLLRFKSIAISIHTSAGPGGTFRAHHYSNNGAVAWSHLLISFVIFRLQTAG